MFKELQNAYSVLSDPAERKWYDDHKEAILRGVDPTSDEAGDDGLNLWHYFSNSSYTSHDDDDPTGFYTVYGDLFDEMIELEEDAMDAKQKAKNPFPHFGNSKTDYADVAKFYNFWMGGFMTKRPFGHADKYKPSDATGRKEKRLMEADNKKSRDAAKREYNATVRQLAQYMKKRDRRVMAYLRKKKEENAKLQEQREKEAAIEAEKQQELRQKAREQYWAEREAEEEDEDFNENMELWNEFLKEDEKKKKKGKKGGGGDEDDEEEETFYCDLCRKNFKSAKQLKEHEKSKKHKALEKAEYERILREEMEKMEEEDEEEEEEEQEEQEEIRLGRH
eukprot:TRINITY_DN66864_c7_g1_i1.p1 TRINITY_DN66864_c7_g1~~TRINITY_DN66864_c7_g1_i1.p1  ORF type:complete len:355 (+),score=94.00 TRINITY_DN66864_c7_g1_i1:63-1067(+)